ncbi:MAG: hypothetical protein HOV82_10175 [Streptomyces sp.]|nr:hypothetical protein [Streptomyces sp.]
MDELVEWLRAQLDEDERTARAAGSDVWRRQDHPSDTVAVYDLKGEPVVYDEGWPTEAQQAHIAAHDPARVLREIDAKRDLLRFAEGVHDHHATFTTGVASRLEATLRLFAAAYVDRPGYRDEWRP